MISDPEDKSKQRLEESLAYLVEEVFIPKQILDAKAAARPAAKAAKNRWDAWARERPEESDEALEALEAQNMWKASNDPYFKDIWDVWGEMVTEETKARLNDKIVWDYWDALDDRGNEAICCVMLAYLDRYLATKLDHLHFKNMNQLMLSAALLAGKWLEDLPLFCKDYAAMVGMGVKDLAELEMLFAKDIDFDFYVSAELIEEYRQGLFNYTPLSLENRISSPVSPLSF